MWRLIASFLLCLTAAAQASPAPTIGDHILPSLVKIIAICGSHGEARIGSGFVWGKRHQVVTDLHVVIGCQMPVDVLYFVKGPDGLTQTARTALVAHVLPSADLVLLTVKNAPDAPSLTVAAKPPLPEQVLEAWGFPLGVEAPIDTRLRVTFANDLFPQLSATLDDDARAELTRLAFPALTSNVLHLNGPLQPGDSGAPVVDDKGDVVGIGSGGLRAGAASISWAMRADYLDALKQSQATMPKAGGSEALFATVVRLPTAGASKPPPGVQCGGGNLTFGGSRTLGALTGGAGGHVPKIIVKRLGDAAQNLPFDLWVDLRSGATALVPGGTSLVPGKLFCRATVDPHTTLLIRVEPLPTDPASSAWALAVAQRRWQALVLYARALKTGLVTMRKFPAWRGQHVVNGALVRHVVLRGRRRPALVLRADLAGPRVSLAEAAVIDLKPKQALQAMPPDRAASLAAVSLASFAPPDETQRQDGMAPNPASPDRAPSIPSVSPTIQCGANFLLMSSVPGFATLARRSSRLPALAAALGQFADVSSDSLASAQFDEWAEEPLGLAILVPRGMGAQSAASKSAAGVCRFTDPADDEVRAALFRRKGFKLSGLASLGAAIGQAIGVRLADFQPMAQGLQRPHAALWAASGTRDGKPWQVIVSAQQQGEWSAIYVIAGSIGGPAPLRLGAGLAGAALAPAETARLIALDQSP